MINSPSRPHPLNQNLSKSGHDPRVDDPGWTASNRITSGFLVLTRNIMSSDHQLSSKLSMKFWRLLPQPRFNRCRLGKHFKGLEFTCCTIRDPFHPMRRSLNLIVVTSVLPFMLEKPCQDAIQPQLRIADETV